MGSYVNTTIIKKSYVGVIPIKIIKKNEKISDF